MFTPTQKETILLPSPSATGRHFPIPLRPCGKLEDKYKLAIISNIDDDLLRSRCVDGHSLRHIITAQAGQEL